VALRRLVGALGDAVDRVAGLLHARSPRSPWPDGTLRLALVRLSRVIDRPASTTVLNEWPRALRRTNSLLVPVSISSRRLAGLRRDAGLRTAFFLVAGMDPP